MEKELPEEFMWLKDVTGPPILVEALKFYGVSEVPGEQSNPIILGWVEEIGAPDGRKDESVAWCATFISNVIKNCGYEIPTERPFKSRSWIDWGDPVEKPEVGDILIFRRKGGRGHIGLYVGETEESYWVYGGNQSAPDVPDSVSIKLLSKLKCVAIRRPHEEPKIQEDETSENKESPQV